MMMCNTIRVLFFSLFFLIFSRFVMAQVCELECRNEHSQRLSKLKTFYHGTQEIISTQESLETCLSQCYTCAKETVSYYIGNYLQCRCPEGSSVQIISPGEPLSACERESQRESQTADNGASFISCSFDDEGCDKCQELSVSFYKDCSGVNCAECQFSAENIDSCKTLKRATSEYADTTLASCRKIYTTEVFTKCKNFKMLPAFEAARKINKKITEELQRVSTLNRSANQCIAAFKQDPDPSLNPYPDSNPKQPNSQASRKTTNWSGLAQTAAQAFENLNGFGLEASIDGGELDSSSNAPNAASSPSFKQFNNNNGGLRESPYSRFNDEDGGGGFNGDGNPGDSIRNSQRTHGNKNPRNQASQAGLTAQRGHGGPSGANGGGFGSRNNGGGVSPSTNANQRGQARRRFASTKKRNLVLGYKRVKRGGSALTYHPTDLKKYGRDHVLTMARKAKKTFGEETPLLFENGEFIRDYLEMKNSLAWKKHNLRQRNRLSGIFKTKEEREKKAFHPCALVGECYTESRYNIFMLHHFTVIKYLKPED